MTKSKINKRKIVPFSVIIVLVILGIFNLNTVYAIHMQGNGATFYPDDEHPTKYGVFIPQPNMYATMSIMAKNQGEFTIMNWIGDFSPGDQETVTYPGEDISKVYPWYFDDYMKKTPTYDGYINPWFDIDWLNVTAYNPHNVNLSSYTLNTVFNYHVMTEGTSPKFSLNNSIPFQIDLIINNPGPKILKVDWLTVNPSAVAWDYDLISPSNRSITNIGSYRETATYDSLITTVDLFEYIVFVAEEPGIYRLLIDADHSFPAELNLEFLNTPVSNLALDKLTSIGNSDEDPTLFEQTELEWQSKWVKFNVKKGEFYQLYLGEDFVGAAPEINLWMPTPSGYTGGTLYPGYFVDLYLHTSGDAYVSFVDTSYGDFYRYSLFLSALDELDYNIGGGNLTSVRISRDQHQLIKFNIENDSFVRFNFTSYDQPEGMPYLLDEIDPAFMYGDSKSLFGASYYEPIGKKKVGSETFYYYYFPAGTYYSIIENSNISFEGVIDISSKYVDLVNETIPISSLTYPNMNPSELLTLEFDPDEYYNSLYQSQCITLEITEPGQYFLNTTIYASENLAAIPLIASPSVVIGYNTTTQEYNDYTTQALAFDNNTFKAFFENDVPDSPGDQVYIAYTSKWHDMHFNFTSGGEGSGGGVEDYVQVYDGNDWYNYLYRYSDTTGEFTDNGTWVNSIGSVFNNWRPGVGTEFDLPHIDESQYYWLRFVCSDDYTDIPYIDLIQLSNITIQGNINFELIGESGYNYSDYWDVPIGSEPTNLLINRESAYSQDSAITLLFDNSDWYPYIPNPYIIGLEEGTYKLLITPHGFGYPGSIQIKFGIENYWPYRHQASFNITAAPHLYMHQMNFYTKTGYSQDNITFYNYGLITQYNDTEASVSGLFGDPIPYPDPSYFVLECYGNAYTWTQLVVSTSNVSLYTIYLMQDLPWVYNSPNYETMQYYPGVAANDTMEFGVFVDHFYLIFEVNELTELVTFRIDLTQYDTTKLTTSVPIATYKGPPADYGLLFLGLAIGVPVVAGIIVVIYILKKKGRIGSKTP